MNSHFYLYYLATSSSICFKPTPPLKRPLLLAATRPTFYPGGANLDTVDG